MNSLRLDAVSFRYPGTESYAIQGLHLDVGCGEFVWLFGRLGSGASTLLLLAAGLAPRLTEGVMLGRVATLGVDPGTTDLTGRVAYLGPTPALQLSGIAPSVREEVAFTPANLGWTRGRIFAAADAALERLGITHLTNRDPGTLSGGELQRVMMAGLLASGPELWLLDDPTSGMDRDGRDRTITMLREEAARGSTVVVASEDTDTYAPFVPRVLILDQGRTAVDGRPAEHLSTEVGRQAAGGTTAVAELTRLASERSTAPALKAPWPLGPDEAVTRWTH